MAWFCIYETLTGRLESEGTIVADPLPAQYSVLILADKPPDSQMWDSTSRTFIERPVRVLGDLVADLLADSDLSGLNNQTKNRIQNAAIRVIPDGVRWY